MGSEEGKKDDAGKLDWDAMPLELIELLVPVFEAGISVKGYGRHNCLQPFCDSRRRFFSAAMRHLRKCQLDPMAWNDEDQCYHAAQVAFNALMLLYHGKQDSAPSSQKLMENTPEKIELPRAELEQIEHFQKICARRM